LGISQVSKYLKMSEEEVMGIINTEQGIFDKTGSFTGLRLPYFKVNNKYYFYKNSVDEWLKQVTEQRRQYNTKEGYMY
jgi:hypothetical protein